MVGVLESAAIGRPFEIQIESLGPSRVGDGAGKRGLAHLPCSEEHDRTVAGLNSTVTACRREIIVCRKSDV
jgi:hypothetical protein